jgi:fructuronate reductase/mannitol 2-dehydrogenase
MPAYLLPSLLQARRRGRPAALLTLALAGWLRYLRGYGLDGAPIEVEDAHRALLQPLALAGGADPRPLLGERWLFGELGADREFVAALGGALADLDRYGVAATLRAHLAADGPRVVEPVSGRAA